MTKLSNWWKYPGQTHKPAGGCFRGKENGVTLIETLVALALLGIVAVAFLSGLATSLKSSFISNEQALAESLIRTEAEYVKTYPYQYYATEYPVDPGLTIPASWTIPPPVVEPVHATDDGIQKVTVAVEHNGEEIFTLEIRKADR